MNFLSENIIASGYESIMVPVASVIYIILEVIGIIALVVGVVRAIIVDFPELYGVDLPGKNIRIDLGHAFSLGLEFKMGAEIIKTVIYHNLEDLLVLGVVIALRAAIFFLLQWEMSIEKKEMQEKEHLHHTESNEN